MGCVLFCRPKHDDTMEYLYHYSKELVDLSKERGLKTLNHEKEKANKLNILKVIEKQKPNLIMFNGHGSPTCIFGHRDEMIISSEENPEVLSNKITYALACASAAELGLKAKEKGAIAFIGYKFDFAIGKDPDSEAAPRRDKIAKYFLEPSNLLFSCLLKGANVGVAVKRAKKLMEENIGFLSTTDEFPEAPHYAPYLFGNYAGLITYGDSEASI